MIGKTIASVEDWTAPAAAAFEFWVSFWPAAPLFGVEWRFADWTGGYTPFTDLTGAKPKKADRPAKAEAKPVTIAVKYAEVERPVAAKAAPTKAPGKGAAAQKIEAAVTAEMPAQKPAARRATARKVAAPKPTAEAIAEAPKAEPVKPADDLKLIKGIGAGLEKQLNALGIQHFAQLAALSDKQLAKLDEKLTTIKGRCFRDDWVGQAKALAV